MATIIQPYNPWRENLAVGLLAPVINNLLQSSQQAAKNAKTAAILGEAYKLNDAPAVSSGIGGDAWVNSYFGGGRSGVGNSGMFGGLTGGGLPQGMNNGLTQFGNGFDQWLQAGNNAVNYGTPAVNNGLSLAKIAQVYGSDPQRFQSVSLDELTKAVSPYVTEAQEAQKRAAVDAYYQGYGNMTPEEQVTRAAKLLGQGYISQGAFDSLMSQTRVTPQQQAELDFKNKQFNAEQQRWNATFGANQAQNDERNWQWWAQFNKVNPQMITGNNGNAYLWGGGNNVTPVTLPDGTQLNIGVPNGGGGGNGFNFVEQYMLNWGDQRAKTIEEQIAALNEKIALAEKPDVIASLESQKSALQSELNQITQQRNAILAPYFRNESDLDVDGFQAGNTGDIGFDVLGGNTNIKVTGNKGDLREGGKRTHMGRDYAVPAGSSIGVPRVQGVNFVVAGAGTSPKGGNYISLQGAAPNGTTVEVIYRHIQSAKAKVGQRVGGNNVVALSGNTGTSTTGAHLHIETKINGKHVDPRNFYKEFEKAEAQAGGNSAASAPGTPTANSNAALQYNSNGTEPYAAGQQAPQAPQVQQTATAPTAALLNTNPFNALWGLGTTPTSAAQSPQAPKLPTTQYQPNDFTAWNAMGQYLRNPSSLPEQFTQTVVDGANLSAEDRAAIQVNAAMQGIPTSAIQAVDQRLNGENAQQTGQAGQRQIQIPPELVFNPQVDNRNNLVQYDEFLKLYEMAEAGRLKNVSINNAQDLINIMLREGKKVYIK